MTLTAAMRRRAAALRQPAASARIALALWVAWAAILWNVVFDHVIVLAGRAYIAAAERAFMDGSYARMDDWMRPAVARGLWVATLSSTVILIAGFLLVRAAARTVRAAR